MIHEIQSEKAGKAIRLRRTVSAGDIMGKVVEEMTILYQK